MVKKGQHGHAASIDYRSDIDGLRGIAVALVVVYHAFPSLVSGGFIGVDIFFVISGYLITSILLKALNQNRFSLLDFYCRRVRRIFPALLFVLCISGILGWFVLLAPEYKQLGKHIAGGAGFISNFILWGESGYFDSTAHSKPLLHLWSLGIEEQFYLLWPLILYSLYRLKKYRLSLVLLLLLFSFFHNILEVGENRVAAFYSPFTRVWELLIGASLAWIVTYPHDFPRLINMNSNATGGRAVITSSLGLFLVFLGIVVTDGDSSFPGWYALFPTMGTCLIIYAGPSGWLNKHVFSNRVLVWLGLISFPLYLWHWSLLCFGHISGITETVEARFGVVVLSMVLAWLTYLFVERPIRFGSLGGRKASLLSVAMFTLGVMGVVCYQADGFKKRFPPVIQNISEFTYDYKSEYREGSCFLRPEQSRREFSKCESTTNPNKETVLIWGDSHAAHLYPGFRDIHGEKYNIIQRTAASCPPLVGWASKDMHHCKAINGQVSLFAQEHKPEIVILAASWAIYDWEKVETTVSILKSYGIKKIEIVGPVPIWAGSLKNQLYNSFKEHALKKVPYRMTRGLNGVPALLDKDISLLAERLDVGYISPYSILCDEDGCLTRTGDDAESLMAWDYGHLTTSGSRYLVSRFTL